MRRNIKYYSQIKILLAISTLFILIGMLKSFFSFYESYFSDSYKLKFNFNVYLFFNYFLFNLLPCLLFCVYIFYFCKSGKAPRAISAVIPFIFLLLSINYAERIFFNFKYYDKKNIIFFYGFLLILFLIDSFSVLNNLKLKFIIPVSLIAGTSYILILTFYYFKNIDFYLEEDFLRINLYTLPFEYCGLILFFIALFLFLMNNKFNLKLEIKNPDKLPVEEALPLLKEQFEYGMYSEEDYKTERMKIISKL